MPARGCPARSEADQKEDPNRDKGLMRTEEGAAAMRIVGGFHVDKCEPRSDKSGVRHVMQYRNKEGISRPRGVPLTFQPSKPSNPPTPHLCPQPCRHGSWDPSWHPNLSRSWRLH